MARLATLNLEVSADDRLDQLRIKLQEACSNGRIYGLLGMEELKSDDDEGDAGSDDADDSDAGDGNFPPDEDPDESGIDAPSFGDDDD